jgi:heme exporter protein CcmD
MNATGLFNLSGHGYFIWASYGMLALAIALELFFLRRLRRRALDQAKAIQKEAPARRASVTQSQNPAITPNSTHEKLQP